MLSSSSFRLFFSSVSVSPSCVPVLASASALPNKGKGNQTGTYTSRNDFQPIGHRLCPIKDYQRNREERKRNKTVFYCITMVCLCGSSFGPKVLSGVFCAAFHRILMGHLGFPWSFPWAVWFRTFNFLMVDTVPCARYFLWPPFHSDLLALPRVPHFHSRSRAPSFRPSSLWGPRKVG